MQRRFLAKAVAALALSLMLCGCSDHKTDIDPTAGFVEDEMTIQASLDAKKASSESVEAESTTPPEEEVTDDAAYLFDYVHGWDFSFCSGAGGWSTDMQINADGSFAGIFHDSELGMTGPGYENGSMYYCKFSGKFTDVVKLSKYVYEAKVTDLTYENEPDETEIIDEVQYIYSGAYGISETEKVQFYLPGAQTAELPEEYMDWVKPLYFHAYVGNDFYWDVPEELPFCGIYGVDNENGFFSVNSSGTNRVFVTNKASFPGLQNEVMEVSDDGTYYCVDRASTGMYSVINMCFKPQKELNPYSYPEEYVNHCIYNLMEGQSFADVYYLDYSFRDSTPDMIFMNGEMTFMAGWTSGTNEDTRYYVARMMLLGDFAYVYAYSAAENDALMHSEAGSFYLSSLTLTADSKGISSANQEKVARKITGIVIANGADPTSLLVDEVKWVTWGDKEMMEKYGLTDEDMTDDYAIVEDDGNYKVYQMSERCPIYVQFPEEGPFREFQTKAGFRQKLSGRTYGYLMELYLDENNVITYAYEPYTP